MLRFLLPFLFILPLNATLRAAEVPPEIVKAMRLPKGDEQNKALDAAAQEWAQKEPTAALAWVLQLPANLSFRESGVVSAVCGRSYGKLSADWLVQQGSTVALERLHGLILAWAPVDAAGAAAWCLQAPKNVRYYAYFTMADALCRKDPPSAADWAAKVEAAEDRLAATHGVAMIWGRSNLAPATAWIKQLKPEEAKLAARVIVGDHYSQLNVGKKDEAAVAAVKEWIEQLPLSKQDKNYALLGPLLDSHGPLWPAAKRK
jgi:hypothetical protein